jgi:hypothetical protein
MWKLLHYMPFPSAFSRDTAIISLIPSMLVVAVALFFALPQRFRNGAAVALLVSIVAELWSATAGWNTTLPQSMSYPATPLTTKLQDLRAADGAANPYRFVGLGPVLFPNANALYGFEDVRVHDPMAYGNYLGFLRVLEGYNPADYFAKWESRDSPLLDLLNVKYLVSDAGWNLPEERYRKVYDGRDGTIFENKSVLPRFFAVKTVITETNHGIFAKMLAHHTDWANTALVGVKIPATAPGALVTLLPSTDTDFRMRVHAPHAALVASSITDFPGWRVTFNGHSLEPLSVNGPFLGFVVPAGDGEVRVHYAPLSFYGGLALSLLTISALVATELRFRRRRRAAAERAG